MNSWLSIPRQWGREQEGIPNMLVIPTQSGERLTGREGKQCGQEQKQLLKKDETFVSISPLTGKSDGLSVLDLLDKDKRQQTLGSSQHEAQTAVNEDLHRQTAKEKGRKESLLAGIGRWSGETQGNISRHHLRMPGPKSLGFSPPLKTPETSQHYSRKVKGPNAR